MVWEGKLRQANGSIPTPLILSGSLELVLPAERGTAQDSFTPAARRPVLMFLSCFFSLFPYNTWLFHLREKNEILEQVWWGHSCNQVSGVSFPPLRGASSHSFPGSANPEVPSALTVPFGRCNWVPGALRGMVWPQVCGAPRMAYVQAAVGWLQERATARKLAAARLCLDLQEHRRVTGQGRDVLWRNVGMGRPPHSLLVPKSCRKKVKI